MEHDPQPLASSGETTPDEAADTLGSTRPRGWRPSRRQRRQLTVAVVVLGTLGVFGAQHAPYAKIAPGPTPDLTAAVAAAQDTGTGADPGLGTGGRLVGTTVDATQLSWFGALWCSVADCAVLPIDTSAPAVADAAAAQMVASQQTAAGEARKLTGTATDYPNAALTADLGQIGGPSAGLMLTLAFVDALTAGDLTGGQVIAGTGTIDVDGRVGPIAGAAQKVAGAARDGASVFFAPRAEADAVRAAAPSGMVVVPVETDMDALTWLCQHGGVSAACPTPGS